MWENIDQDVEWLSWHFFFALCNNSFVYFFSFTLSFTFFLSYYSKQIVACFNKYHLYIIILLGGLKNYVLGDFDYSKSDDKFFKFLLWTGIQLIGSCCICTLKIQVCSFITWVFFVTFTFLKRKFQLFLKARWSRQYL